MVDEIKRDVIIQLGTILYEAIIELIGTKGLEELWNDPESRSILINQAKIRFKNYAKFRKEDYYIMYR